MPSNLFYLHAPSAGEAKAALTLGQGLPKTRNTLPCHYFWRPAIADGEYVHPTKGFRLSVNADRRKTWEQNFAKLQAAGIEEPIVADHKEQADACLGYVVGVRNNGAWYEELHQYLGDDARDIALRNRVSVGIDPDFVDGTGRRVGDCIVHSAITPVPVVPGQGDAIPIAASRGRGGDVLVMSTEKGQTMPEETKPADEQGGETTPPTEEPKASGVATAAEAVKTAAQAAIDAFRGLVDAINGLGEGTLAEGDVTALKEAIQLSRTAVDSGFTAINAADGKLPKEPDADAVAMPMSMADYRKTRLDLSAARTQIQQLSASNQTVDPRTLKLMAKTVRGKLEMAVAKGGITPDVAKKLGTLLLGNDDQPNRLTLSLADGQDTPLAWQVFELLAENKPTAMGSATGVQELSRQVPGDTKPTASDKNPLLETAQRMNPAKK
jgi:hypothetical protein